MTTILTADTLGTEAREATPGCGCCIPPPDSVDTRVAQLEERRQRLERKLAALRSRQL